MTHPLPLDPALPLLADLLDPAAAAELIGTALNVEEVTAVRVIDVAYRPQTSLTVRYSVDLAGETEPVGLVATHGGNLPIGGVRVSDGTHEVAFWRFPDDFGLPGLGVLFDPVALARLLGELGVRDEAPRPLLRAYRPGRRAVAEINADGRRLFAKVVRPKRVAELQTIHAALSPTVPVPQSLGWQPDLGLLFMEAIPGTSLTTALLSGRYREVAGPADLIALLDLIAGARVDTRPRPTPLQRAADHAATLQVLVPETGDLLTAVMEASAAAPAEDPILAHRDFHSAQLLVADGRLRLVDVDTVGVGTRADDLAMLLAQLICLARPGPAKGVIETYRSLAVQEFHRHVSPQSLRPRVAAALLGFAQGPFRVQEADWPGETMRRVVAAHDLVTGGLKNWG